MRVLDRADTYEKAVSKQKKAEETSDLQTTASEDDQRDDEFRVSNRRKRTTARLVSEDDESDSEPPPMPPQRRAKLAPQDMPVMEEDVSVTRPDVPVPPPRTPIHSIMSRVNNATASPSTSSSNSTASNLSGRDVRILTLLEQLRAEINQVLQRLDASQGNETADSDLPEDVIHVFPLKSIAALESLDKHLHQPACEKSLVSRLAVIGGSSIQDTVRRIMKDLLHHDLALKLDWSGKGDKRSFGSLKLRVIITKAVRKNNETSEATENDIEKSIKEWLRGASDRNGGRKKRMSDACAKSPCEQSAHQTN